MSASICATLSGVWLFTGKTTMGARMCVQNFINRSWYKWISSSDSSCLRCRMISGLSVIRIVSVGFRRRKHAVLTANCWTRGRFLKRSVITRSYTYLSDKAMHDLLALSYKIFWRRAIYLRSSWRLEIIILTGVGIQCRNLDFWGFPCDRGVADTVLLDADLAIWWKFITEKPRASRIWPVSLAAVVLPTPSAPDTTKKGTLVWRTKFLQSLSENG